MPKPRRIKRLLVANRGEIALRVIRTCREMSIEPDALYSDADRNALHIVQARSSYRLPGNTPQETYLNIPLIVDICKRNHIDAVHPGYGFLAENADFAKALEDENIIFVGPTSKCIHDFGDKLIAKNMAEKAGVRGVPGTLKPVSKMEDGLKALDEIRLPVIIKAAAGGGGRGMRVVRDKDDFARAFHSAQSESMGAFASDKVFLEKYIEEPRHIEVQIMGDTHGNIVHFGERECSIQRRHQKLLEEAPSAVVTEEMRHSLGEAAVKVAKSGNYAGAGTVEFLMDRSGEFYFIEMNTRLQVEHPVTEQVTGTDLVREQILVAEGRKQSFKQKDIVVRGHSIETRINAEDPLRDFLPALGRINRYIPPMGNGVRLDSSAYEGYTIPMHYDSLVGKLITYGSDRLTAIRKMQRALREFIITGVKTTIPFHIYVMSHPDFVSGKFSTSFVDRNFTPEKIKEFITGKGAEEDMRDVAIASALIAYLARERAHPDTQAAAPQSARPDAWVTRARSNR